MSSAKSRELFAPSPGGGIHLRHPSWAEFDDWATLRRENADWLMPWEPEWDPAHMTRQSYRQRLARLKRLNANQSAYPFHIFAGSHETLIGAIHLNNIQRAPSASARMGYWLGEAYSGRGFARAAVRAVTRYGYETLGLHRIEAAVQPDNVRSIRLLDATGFCREGVARGYLKINGAWADHVIYAKLSSD